MERDVSGEPSNGDIAAAAVAARAFEPDSATAGVSTANGFSVVIFVGARSFVQVLLRADADVLDVVDVRAAPAWIPTDGGRGVRTRVSHADPTARRLRFDHGQRFEELPIWDGAVAIINWNVGASEELSWPPAAALLTADGWTEPVRPDIYWSVKGFASAFLCSLDDDADEGELAASIMLDELVNDDPPRALEILDIATQQASDEQLGGIGAGTLENLLVAHGKSLVPDLSRRVTRNARLRAALGSAWLTRASKDTQRAVEGLLRDDQSS